MALRFGALLREARLLLVYLSLAVAVISAVVILISVISPYSTPLAQPWVLGVCRLGSTRYRWRLDDQVASASRQ